MPDNRKVRFPVTFSVKDVLVALSVVTTVAFAWGVGSARIAVIERDYINLKLNVEQHQKADKLEIHELLLKVDKLKELIATSKLKGLKDYNQIEGRLRELEFIVKREKKR